MQIEIAEKLMPFSHQPGAYCVLPRTCLRFQIFPALIRVHNIGGAAASLIAEIDLSIRGPVEQFTVQLDLEKEVIRVFGHSQKGFFRYLIAKDEAEALFTIIKEKEPEDPIHFQADPPCAFTFSESSPRFFNRKEKLSLGCHKSQDFELIRRRSDLTEILPHWFHLGQMVPKPSRATPEGTGLLLEECRREIILGNKMSVLNPFKALFFAGFSSLFSPRLTDEEYQGYLLNPLLPKSSASPLTLLTDGYQLIRSLFFSYNDQVADILPLLPPDFHSGRLLFLRCGSIGRLDMEWSKKSIRRLIFHCEQDGAIRFHFQPHLKTFRARSNKLDFGHRIEIGKPISLKNGISYILDRFEK